MPDKIALENYQSRLDELTLSIQQIETAKQVQSSLLTEQYSESLTTLSRIYRLLPASQVEKWTIPTIFRKTHDENFISHYLAYVLDPNKNGIGVQPLVKLLKLISCDYELFPGQKVEIIREYPLQERRIDILILIGDNLVIGLENKIFARESEGQTAFYEMVMDQLFQDRERHYVFLTITGDLADSNEFRAISYQQLLAAFKIVEFSECDLRKRAFWEDFLLHVEEHLTMNSNNRDIPNPEKLALYLKHHEMINDLQSAYGNARDAVFNSIVDDIQSAFDCLEWKFDFNPVRSWQLMLKPHWSLANPPIRVMWVLWFTRDLLLENEFQISVEVQGYPKNWDTQVEIPQFFNMFKPRFENLKNEYREKGMTYLKKTRARPELEKLGIAWKKYPLIFNPDQVETVSAPIIQAINEFVFLIPSIDETLKEIAEKNLKSLLP